MIVWTLLSLTPSFSRCSTPNLSWDHPGGEIVETGLEIPRLHFHETLFWSPCRIVAVHLPNLWFLAKSATVLVLREPERLLQISGSGLSIRSFHLPIDAFISDAYHIGDCTTHLFLGPVLWPLSTDIRPLPRTRSNRRSRHRHRKRQKHRRFEEQSQVIEPYIKPPLQAPWQV